MKQKSNNYSQEFTTAINAPITDELFDSLDSLTLNKAFLEEDFVELANFSVKPDIALQKAIYITEIDGEFYLLDCTSSTKTPEPTPLNTINVVQSRQIAKVNTEPFANSTTNQSTSNSFFLGKKGLFLGVGLGVLLTLGATRLFLAPTSNNPESTANVTDIVPAQAVTVTKVTTTDIDNRLNASGTVTAYERTPVMSQAEGLQITEVLAEKGDVVKQGQVLVRLDNRGILAQKAEAEGSVAQVQARLDELQAGTRTEEIAQAEAKVDNARSAIAKAESDLKLVQKRVERNRNLQTEGAITRDSFDQVLNQEQVTKSDLAGAKANFQEAKQALVQLKAGSRPQTIAQAQAELVQAKGRLEGIEAQLADTTVVAPTSGIIASRDAKVGQITSASQMLFSIIENGRLELRLQIPETLIGKIKPGQLVQISSNANRDLDLTGKVREIDPLIDDSSRQATVEVDLPSETNLKPGMFLQAAISTNTSKGQAVPIEALLPQSGNNAIAFVLQSDNTVKAQTVKMGEILSGEKVEVIEGLQSGDRIVLKGAAYLQDGDRVKVSNDQV